MYQTLATVLLIVMSIRISILVSVVAGAILLTGCGSPSVNQASVLKDLIANNASNAANAPAVPGLSAGSGSDSSGSGDSGSGSGAFTMNSDCFGVMGAYASIALAMLPSLTGGNGTYDAAKLTQAISGLSGKVPDELKPDFATLSAAANAASGKSLDQAGQILGSDAVTKASDHISQWTDKNCGG